MQNTKRVIELKTRAKVYILTILIAIVLMLSIVSMVSAEDTGVFVRARTVGIDKNTSKEITIIDITTNKTGNLKYIEWYYSKNESGKYKRDTRILHFNETVTNNVAILKIKRPLDPTGKPYSVIRALIFVDGQLVLNSMYKTKINTGQDVKQEKKSPGFEIAMSAISIISLAYILKKRRK